MATSVAGDIFGKEELLFAGVVTGTFEQYKDQLNSVGDVNVRGLRQRTLLYVAVGLGKVDWVEGLLEKGANPGLRDAEGVSVVELAQALAEKYPEHEDRQSISKLVRLVMKVRESVAQGGCNTTSTCQDKGMEAMGHDMTSDMSRKMALICESTNDIQSKIAKIDKLRVEITANRNLINDIKTEIATDVKTEMAAVRGAIHDIKTEMTNIDTQLQEIAGFRNSIDDLKAGLAARDLLLSALENSVTSMANRERPGVGTPGTSTVPEEVVQLTPRTEEEITPERARAEPEPSTTTEPTTETPTLPEKVLQSAPRTEEELKKQSVEAMMRKTRILESDELKVTRARGWYEKLYSKGDETACLFKFLKGHGDVSIEIDFDSWNIGRIKSSFTDHGGVERDGSDNYYFAEFEERKIYLGGEYLDENWAIGCLAGAVAQMSVCLAFNNGGRPYAKGDDVTERQMKNAIKEAEEEYRRNRSEVDWFIYIALLKETQRGKEVYLTSAVPSIIARLGSTEGTSRLQRQAPLLLELFRDSVMPALLSKAQV